MKKFFKECPFLLLMALAIITSAIFITIMIAPTIHAWDVKTYDLMNMTGLSKEAMAQEIKTLCDYLWIWHKEPLQLAYFTMSEGGVIHFQDVKNIFEILSYTWLISTLITIVYGYQKIKKDDVLFLKRGAITTIVIPALIGLIASFDFDYFFVKFHTTFFSNDYWIFDWNLDPVIRMLPEGYFMHCFIAIILITIALAAIVYGLYKHILKNSINVK